MLKITKAVFAAILASLLLFANIGCKEYLDTAKGDSVSVTTTSQDKGDVTSTSASGSATSGQVDSDDDDDDDTSGVTTTYTVMYNGSEVGTISATKLASILATGTFTYDTDYTISGLTITLTDSGYEKYVSLSGDDETGYDDGTGSDDETGYDDETGSDDETGYDDGTGSDDETGYDDETGSDDETDDEDIYTNGPFTADTQYTVISYDGTNLGGWYGAALNSYVSTYSLEEGTDYSLSGTTVTLKNTTKVQTLISALSSEDEE